MIGPVRCSALSLTRKRAKIIKIKGTQAAQILRIWKSTKRQKYFPHTIEVTFYDTNHGVPIAFNQRFISLNYRIEQFESNYTLIALDKALN